MPDPSLRAVASNSAAAANSLTINKPTGTVDGDGMIMTVSSSNATTGRTATTPAGWTPIGSGLSASFGGFEYRRYSYFRKALGEGASYTVNFSGTADDLDGVIRTYQDVKADAAWIGATANNSGSSQTTTFPGITATTGSLIDLSQNDAYANPRTPPTGFTERYDFIVYVATKASVSAGATGNFTMTNGNVSGTEPFLAETIEVLAGGATDSPDRWFDYEQIAKASFAPELTLRGWFDRESPADAAGSVTNLTVSVTSATSTAVVRAAGKIVAATATGTVARVKVVGKSVPVTAQGTVAALKSVGKSVAAAAASAVATVQGLVFTRVIAATASGAVTVTRQASKGVAATAASAVALARSTGKTIAAAATGTTATARVVGKLVAVTSATATTTRRAVGKVVTVAGTTATSVAAGLAFIRVIAVSATTSVSVTASRAIGVVIAVAASTATAVVRQVGKGVAASGTTAVALTKSAGKMIAAAAAGVVGVTRHCAKGVAVACVGTVAVVKSIGKRIAATATSVVGLLASFLGFNLVFSPSRVTLLAAAASRVTAQAAPASAVTLQAAPASRVTATTAAANAVRLLSPIPSRVTVV